MTTQSSPAPTSIPRDGGAAAVDVVAWRARRLRDAGFAPRLAADLARQRVDLHSLLQLVDRGCPPHLAARILGPTEPPELP